MKRKAIALLLALVMCLGLAVPAFAATYAEEKDGITITLASDRNESRATISYTGTGKLTASHLEYAVELLCRESIIDAPECSLWVEIGPGITTEMDGEHIVKVINEVYPQYGLDFTSVNFGSAPQTVGGFTDVKPGDYFADPVLWAVNKKVTSGTSATTFSPNENCTVAQILTFLWRAYGSPSTSMSNPFSDVKTSDYYYKAALWAYKNGMVSGSTFDGNRPCTRSMAVTYMWKAAGGTWADSDEFDVTNDGRLYGYHGEGGNVVIPDGITNIEDGFNSNKALTSLTIPVSVTEMNWGAFVCCFNLTDIYYEGSREQWDAIKVNYVTGGDWAFGDSEITVHCNSKMPEQTVNTSFTDVPATADYAQAVAWAVKKGVTSGTTATTFSPDGVCTRGQIVTFLHRGLAK